VALAKNQPSPNSSNHHHHPPNSNSSSSSTGEVTVAGGRRRKRGIVVEEDWEVKGEDIGQWVIWQMSPNFEAWRE
jgi:hypothetical protein